MSELPPTRSPAPHVLVVGNLTIDDVVLPIGEIRMAMLGGNSVHAATAVVTAGATAALIARRGEDFPAGALTALADAGVDVAGVVDIPGPTVRNWVIYEEDGSRRWLYRTPPERSAQVAPQPEDLPEAALRLAAVVHVAAMPLGHAERIVARVRRLAPEAVITLDTHETWEADVAGRVLELARAVGLFVPSLEELSQVVGSADPADGLAALAHAGVSRAVVKVGSGGAYLLESGRIMHVPALDALAADATGAGDAFCGGLAAGLARGMPARAAVGLGCAVAGTAITGSGSLRLLEPGTDRAALATAGQRLAAAATEVRYTAMTTPSAPAGHAAERPAQEAQNDADPRYDIEVMRREIQTIPDVISDVLDDADGRIAPIAKRLSEQGISHLWLTGCGDSAFAGIAAELAFQRHTAVTAHPVHALDLARYRIRRLPAASAVIATSYSGKVGRTIEAALQARSAGHPVIALTSSAGTDLARASDEILPVEVPTLGFSPGTSTYVAMVCTLLRLAGELAQLGGAGGDLIGVLGRLPSLVATTLRDAADAAPAAAELLLSAPWTAFLGAGPNEATARFGAAKLIEAAQHLGVAANLEEWAHEEYFVTSAGDPVVLINPSGAGHDRGLEILSELTFMGARPIVISDSPPPTGSSPPLLLPTAAGAAEELSPVTACLPLALVGFHLAAMTGKRSYNFPSAAAKEEHYETIHRVTVGEPA
ncbi:MAG TPA: PfkB family carbohydrate kinase [Streptosporangiaceae bacterium]|nr:PfkB family carbohydrate kinase [Streptosporangiaceae bacterium]